MARSRSPIEPLLDSLAEDGDGLSGEFFADGFEHPWTVYVREPELSPATREALAAFFAPDLKRRATRWMNEYYRKVVAEAIRPQMGPKAAARHAPVLRRPGDVWALVHSHHVSFPADDPDADFTVGGSCAWDDEHGYEFDVKRGRAVLPDFA